LQVWEATTDAQGHCQGVILLRNPALEEELRKGDALLRLEARVTDPAGHSEQISRTYPLGNQALRVSLLPEGGRVVPNMENRIFVVTSLPDGSPAPGSVQIWAGAGRLGEDLGEEEKLLAEVKTDAAGLGEFRLTPGSDGLAARAFGRTVETVDGRTENTLGWKLAFPYHAQATNGAGESSRSEGTLSGEPLGENVLLRLDKALCQPGDRLQVETYSTAGLPVVRLDLVKGGQVVRTQEVPLRGGKGRTRLDLPPDLFGTVEVHASQILDTGEVIRDGRVLYVGRGEGLKVEAQGDRDVYRPSEKGVLRFQVTDNSGMPAAAALGVLAVDEAVFALQDVRPGLEQL
jgi:hypothetical protein